MKAWICKALIGLLLALAGTLSPARAQYIPGAACPAHQWADGYGFTTGLACAQPNYSDLSGTPPSANYALASGFVNKLRGNSLSQWYSGGVSTGITISTAGGWASEGVYVVPTGASVTASQVASPQAGGPYFALKILGASSNTDVKLRFPIESYDAAILAGQTVTFQVTYQNKSGGTITPTLTTKYAGSQDVWTSPTTDLSATSLQSCPNNSICTASYTLSATASANSGYTPTVDFGALTSGNYIEIVSFDMRATPSVATGLNAAPPAPEILHPAEDALWCQRFYRTTYDNGTAPGSATHAGMVALPPAGSANIGIALQFGVRMRAAPAMAYWDGAGNANEASVYASGGYSDNNLAVTAVSSSTQGALITVGSSFGNPNLIHFAADARIAGN
jgi:hypothetical protein